MSAPTLSHHLEVLPAMLNLVLVQTGKILRDPDFHNPQHASLTKRRISEFVPAASEEFQTALDAIEVEILQAKATMERDLSRIRQKRAERERLSAQAKALTLPKENTEPGMKEFVSPATNVPIIIPTAQHHEPGPDQDTLMSNSFKSADGEALVGRKIDDASNADGKDQTIMNLDGMPQDSQNTAGLAISMGNEPSLEDLGLSMNLTDEPLPVPGLDGTLTVRANGSSDGAKNDGDFEIESMFHDSSLMPQDGTMDIDFDFSTNNNDAQNPLADSTIDGMVLSNEDLAKAIPATNEDLDSLLPGLDSYVNAGGEAAAATNPATTNTAAVLDAVQANQNADATNTAGNAAADVNLGDASFDDFFNPADFDTGANAGNINNGNDGNALGDGQFEGFEEFNYDWFKM